MRKIRPRPLAAPVPRGVRARSGRRARRRGRLRELALVPRRRRAARGQRRPAAAAYLEHDGERRLEDGDRRARLVVAGDLGRPDLPDDRRQRRRRGRAPHGASTSPTARPRRWRTPGFPSPRKVTCWSAPSTFHHWLVAAVDLRKRRRPLDDRGARGRARLRPAPEEHLRVVDAGDRRRADLTPTSGTSASTRWTWTGGSSGKSASTRRRRASAGGRRLRRYCTRTRSSSSTTTTSTRSWWPSTPPPERGGGASTATRAPTGPRRTSGGTTSARSSSPSAATWCAPTASTAASSGASAA